jgi:hypothetical protein
LREEQRAYCKIRGFLGKCASELKTDLDLAYEETAFPYPTIDRWVSMLKEGRTNVKDDHRSEPPIPLPLKKTSALLKP